MSALTPEHRDKISKARMTNVAPERRSAIARLAAKAMHVKHGAKTDAATAAALGRFATPEDLSTYMKQLSAKAAATRKRNREQRESSDA